MLEASCKRILESLVCITAIIAAAATAAAAATTNTKLRRPRDNPKPQKLKADYRQRHLYLLLLIWFAAKRLLVLARLLLRRHTARLVLLDEAGQVRVSRQLQRMFFGLVAFRMLKVYKADGFCI